MLKQLKFADIVIETCEYAGFHFTYNSSSTRNSRSKLNFQLPSKICIFLKESFILQDWILFYKNVYPLHCC